MRGRRAKGTETFSVRLPRGLLEILKAQAEAEDRTVASLIRRAVRLYLTEDGR